MVMFNNRGRTFLNLLQISTNKLLKGSPRAELGHRCFLRSSCFSNKSFCPELPRTRKRSEKKSWVTDINDVKREARLQRQERRVVREMNLKPPENGLLVKNLTPVARHVLLARSRLLFCASQLSRSIPIYFCSVCGDVHVGDPPHKIRSCNVRGSQKSKEHLWKKGGVEHVLPVVESFHLYDRLGRAVSHDERLTVDRVPAIIELCIQAGVDIPEYPTRRRDFPVYSVAGRMIDFEKRFPKHGSAEMNTITFNFWGLEKKPTGDGKVSNLSCDDMKGLADQGIKAFDKLRSGVVKLMKKYAVQTCGHCNEVQVGPKGHRVRQCQAFKHQMRDGQHGWQEASVDDIFPPVYVWHVGDSHDKLLIDALKRYYGRLPAAVELFAQAGASVPENYRETMREDVSVPGLHEEKLVV